MIHHHPEIKSKHPNSCGLCCTKIEDFKVQIGRATLVDDVNVHLHCGELTAIIGPNGAGKSTFLKAVLGVLPFTGTLRFLDVKGERTNRPIMGYVPQNLEFDSSAPMSVLDLFAAAKSRMPVWLHIKKSLRAHVLKQLKRVKAEHVIDKRLGDLSGGELQRILLALALDPIPDILLLDEPVSGVDHNGLEMFYALVNDIRAEHDLTILLVSHDLPLVSKYADRVVLINRKMQACGTPGEVFGSEEFGNIFGAVHLGQCERKIKNSLKSGDEDGEGSNL